MKDRYNLFVIVLTTMIIFLFWKYLLSATANTTNYTILAFVGFFTSFGIYKLLVTLLHSTARKIEIVNRIFSGNEYLNGTWIGFYKGASGKVRYIVERYEQNLDEIIIRGHSYDEAMNLHATWNSTSVQINSKIGKIVYTYTVTSLDENTNGLGIAEFDFERKSEKEFPTIIQGYSSDIHIGKRVRSFEKKVTKRDTLKKDEAGLVLEAKNIYDEYEKLDVTDTLHN